MCMNESVTPITIFLGQTQNIVIRVGRLYMYTVSVVPKFSVSFIFGKNCRQKIVGTEVRAWSDCGNFWLPDEKRTASRI